MKKNLLLSAVLVAGLFAGNVFGIRWGRETTAGDVIDAAGKAAKSIQTIEVKNKTKGDIWVTFNTLSEKCVGGCSYTRIGKNEKKSPEESRFGSLLNVYAYEDCKSLVKKGYKVKGNKVEVTVEGKNIVITEID